MPRHQTEVIFMPNDNNQSVKKSLANTRKQLRVWVEKEKYERFKQAVAQNDASIYSVINSFIDSYIQEAEE